MSKKPKKTYHHGNLREQLILAGRSALDDLPVEAVTLREIARRAGVSHAAPKHHFATLADLLGEIAALGFENFHEELASAADKMNLSPDTRLLAMCRAYVKFASENAPVYGLMFGKHGHCAMTRHLETAQFAAWEQLERAVVAVTGKAKAKHEAVLVWSSVHGLSMLKLENRLPHPIDPHQALEDMWPALIKSLKASD